MRALVLCQALLASAALAQAAAPPPTPAAEPPPPTIPSGEVGQAALGGMGLDRVRSAFLANRALSVSLRGAFFRTSQLTVPAGTDEYRATLVGASFSPLPMLEFSALLRSTTLEQPASPSGNYWLVNDFFFKVKAGTTFLNGALALAGEAYLRLPPPLFRADPVWQGISPGFGGLFSYDFRRHGVPVLFHANVGLYIDQSVDFDDRAQDLSRRFALDIVTFNQFRAGAGLEGRFIIGPVGLRPFLEWASDAAMGAAGPPRMWLNPGVRVLPWRGLFVDGLVEIGLTKVSQPGLLPVPPWQLQFAVGWQAGVDPAAGGTSAPEIIEKVVEKEKLVAQAPTTGRVQGLVLDAATKKPLSEAVVQVPGRNRILTEADGRFAIEAVTPGTVKVVASRAGYEPKEQGGAVDKGGLLNVELALSPLPPEPPKPMSLKGTVLDENEKPVAATLAIPGAGLAGKSKDTGEFTFEKLPAGEQIVEVSAPGYLAQARRLSGNPGDALVVDFVLKAVPKQSLVVLKKDKIEIKKQVHFATGRDVILPDSAPLLDQVAAIILEHDKLKVIRVEGHTDDQGDDSFNLELSQRRANSVMRALQERGVDGARLKAIGYGETKPVADNKKPAGRALNRRVEFMIEAQE